jgi:hypothetical protein
MAHFTHDCPECESLGSFMTEDGHQTDLYVCYNDFLGPSVVARYGDEAPEYSSMPVKILMLVPLPPSHALAEALRRLIGRN